MAWNPEKYNEYKAERYKPFFDLISHISNKPDLKVIDLGCGTGELTKLLADELNNPTVLGIDSSAEMLALSPVQDNLVFKQKTIEEQVSESKKWDLIFSNAALQWVDNHQDLLPALISILNPNGQLAIQMPSQTENLLNKILIELVQEEPYASFLHNWKRTSPVLTIDEYASILFSNGGKEMIIYQKMYPIISKGRDDFYEFIAGSALVPYFERLHSAVKDQFINEFKRRINLHFPAFPSIYAFKRMILYAVF